MVRADLVPAAQQVWRQRQKHPVDPADRADLDSEADRAAVPAAVVSVVAEDDSAGVEGDLPAAAVPDVDPAGAAGIPTLSEMHGATGAANTTGTSL